MTHPLAAEAFFAGTGLTPAQAFRETVRILGPAHIGELFMERGEAQELSWRDGKPMGLSRSAGQGYSARYIEGEKTGFAFSENFNLSSLRTALKAARQNAALGIAPAPATAPVYEQGRQDSDRLSLPTIYSPENPLLLLPGNERIRLLKATEDYIRAKDPAVQSVSLSLSLSMNHVHIIRHDGTTFTDSRPFIQGRLNVVVAEDGVRESAGKAVSGRAGLAHMLELSAWQAMADEALKKARAKLHTEPAPVGEMTVVLGNGWGGVMLHEAVGHGLEGDAIRKGQSVFAGRIGERVAAPGVTVVDQGNIHGSRGSYMFDDEGMPARENVLIEDGILVGYMQDLKNARLMNQAPTGNGRRESFRHDVMPRMTNTFMRAGTASREEMIASVDNGLYVVSLGGGQVDPVSGRFVFDVSEAYKIRDGKLGAGVKGAVMSGYGPELMQRIDMIGDDLEIFYETGICSKSRQEVPVTVGQPSVRMHGVMVGGTETAPK